ncbi:hypothetical protein BJV78DRAFT_1257561 [Lactifluus subvellereus]|nr:hypothetical protein BJV78DRAFT_1257561 [Lactifluus subvellereus]
MHTLRLILFYCPMWWATHKGGTVKTCYVRTRMSMPPPNDTLTLAATRIGCEESAHRASPVSFCCLQSASARARPALPLPHYTIRQPEVELILPSLFRGGNSSRANSDVAVVYASGRFQVVRSVTMASDSSDPLLVPIIYLHRWKFSPRDGA